MKKLFPVVFVIFLGYLMSFFFTGKAKGYELFPDNFELKDIGKSIDNWFEDVEDFFEDLDKPNVSPEDEAIANEHFETAMTLFNEGEYEDAKWEFYDAFSYNPLLFEALFYEGKCNYLTEDYYSALSNFEELNDQSPIFDSSYFYIGLINSELEYYYDAAGYFEYFIEYEPESKEAYYEMSWCHYYLDDVDFAIENAQKALEIDDKYADANFSLGYFLLNEERYEEAIHHCIVAFKIGEYAGAAYNAAYCYNKLEMRDSTYFYLFEAIGVNEEYVLANSFLAELYYEDKQYYKSIKYADITINLEETNGLAYNYRAKSNFELRNYQRALTDFEKYYEISEKYETIYNLAMCNEKLGLTEEALSLYSQYLQYVDDETITNEVLQKIESLQQ